MEIFEVVRILYPKPNIIQRAEQFTNTVIGTVDYTDSNQSDTVKVWQDHFVSKVGEEATAFAFRKVGNDVIGPDYEVYEAKNKNWDDDLTVSGMKIAVKTQRKTSADRYGLSWTFQSGGRRRDPILTQPDSWVCFVLCDDTTDKYICSVYPPRQIKSLVFGEPKLTKLIGLKKMVYADENELDRMVVPAATAV